MYARQRQGSVCVYCVRLLASKALIETYTKVQASEAALDTAKQLLTSSTQKLLPTEVTGFLFCPVGSSSAYSLSLWNISRSFSPASGVKCNTMLMSNSPHPVSVSSNGGCSTLRTGSLKLG
eukprot:GHUV01034221.1.p1 GENE.GHUV01034221.1~~GHUV01034221.1.p1  ORF type:complete len:121 (-),score=2.26 GHUV01034221.1:259-621(-)